MIYYSLTCISILLNWKSIVILFKIMFSNWDPTNSDKKRIYLNIKVPLCIDKHYVGTISQYNRKWLATIISNQQANFSILQQSKIIENKVIRQTRMELFTLLLTPSLHAAIMRKHSDYLDQSKTAFDLNLFINLTSMISLRCRISTYRVWHLFYFNKYQKAITWYFDPTYNYFEVCTDKYSYLFVGI